MGETIRFKKAFNHIRNHFGLINAIKLIAIPRIASRIPGVNISYTNRLQDFIRREIGDIIEKYRKEPLYLPSSNKNSNIWSLWWQGKGDVPEVVKLCRKSLLRNSNGFDVVLLNQKNYSDFITLPKFIIERQIKGEISLSHLSDIIRVGLLSRYGGIWLDSCLCVVKPIVPTKRMSMPRFEPNNSGNLGKWCFGAISTPSGHKLMRYMYDCLLRYWEKYDTAIDYLMFDSFMMIAYKEFPDVKKEIDSFEISSPDLHNSRYSFIEKTDKHYFDKIIEDNRYLSLTWRIDYPKSSGDSDTYYGTLYKLFNGTNIE